MDKAVRKYLQHYAEPEAAIAAKLKLEAADAGLVIPCYREPARCLQTWQNMLPEDRRCLLVVVVNRPLGSAIDSNVELLNGIEQLQLLARHGNISSHRLGENKDLICVRRDSDALALSTKEGVGTARKIGCDILLALHVTGTLRSHWLHNSDADAELPDDYFHQTSALSGKHSAALYRFRHKGNPDDPIFAATRLYELSLHHYVEGLRSAGSPYAYHTIGSCIAVDALSYARVRGFPKRAGGEDFYLLNKLNKLLPVTQLDGKEICIHARISDRVPFGTGPAVDRLMGAKQAALAPLFHHPYCFEALGYALRWLEQQYPATAGKDTTSTKQKHLTRNASSPKIDKILLAMGADTAILHSKQHSYNRDQYLRHIHTWFDGFKTLKFIHAIRELGYPDLNKRELEAATRS